MFLSRFYLEEGSIWNIKLDKKFSVFDKEGLWDAICCSSLPGHRADNTLPDIFAYPWLKGCSDIDSTALLCSLMYHLVALVFRGFSILSNIFGCEYISICHDHGEHRGLLLFFPLFNTGRLLPTELLEYCFHALLQYFLSLSPPPSPPPQQTSSFVFPNRVYLHISESCDFHYSISNLSSPLLLFGFPELDSGVSPIEASQASSTAN